MICALQGSVQKMPGIQEFRKENITNRQSITIGIPRFEKPTTALIKSSNAE